MEERRRLITRYWLVKIVLGKNWFLEVRKPCPKAYTVPTNFFLRNASQQKIRIKYWFLMIKMVGRTGVEPLARWLRVSCSTNWANGPPKREEIEKAHKLRSRCSSFSTYCLVRFEVLTACGLAWWTFWTSSNHKSENLVRLTGFEPVAPCSGGKCSIHWATGAHVLRIMVFWCFFPHH